jgi:hypothetical protein
MMGGDTKNHMACLGTMYDVVANFETDASPIDPSYKNLIIIHDTDLSEQWKITRKCGGMTFPLLHQ